MKNLFAITVAAASLSLGACSSNPTTSASSYDATVEQATATHAKAAEMGNVWQQKKMKLPYVEDYLAKAAEAKAKGEDDKAMKLAQEALKTAKAEVEQSTKYADLKGAWIK